MGLALLAGCATDRAGHYVPLTGDPMIDGPNAITNGPPRDKVLWQYRTAQAAMHRGQYDMAARYLDEALDRIEGVIGSDPQSRKARSYFTAEAKKTFIGEPYERCHGLLLPRHPLLDERRAGQRPRLFPQRPVPGC